MEVLIDSLNNTRHPRIRVTSNKKQSYSFKKLSKHKTNLKPKHVTLYMQEMERRKTKSGYMPDYAGHRLLLRKWPAA